MALKPAGLKSIKPLQKQKGNRKVAQEESVRGSQTGWGSIQQQAGWLSARSPLPSSFGKVQRCRHPCSVPSHSFLYLRRKARADYISSQAAQLCSGTGTPRRGAGIWHRGHEWLGRREFSPGKHRDAAPKTKAAANREQEEFLKTIHPQRGSLLESQTCSQAAFPPASSWDFLCPLTPEDFSCFRRDPFLAGGR